MNGGENKMSSIYFDLGYRRALMDLISFVAKPNKQLAKPLCNPKRLTQVLQYILENWEKFQRCPDVFEFEFEFEIVKNKMVLKK